MSIRDPDHTNLSESIDSNKMVNNLAGAQQFIPFSMFLTLTANHSIHPGLASLHAWKDSMQWIHKINGYDTMSLFDKIELKKAMEEAYGFHVYSSWNLVKNI